MKLFRFFVVVGFLAICASVAASVALADGVDPTVIVKNICNGCDAAVIGPGLSSVQFSATITCSSLSDPTSCFATEDIINFSGVTLTSFDLSLTSPGLTFSCLDTTDYTCSTIVTGSLFAFTLNPGATPFCSTDANDISPAYNPSNPAGPYTYSPDYDADDACSAIEITLQGTPGEDPGTLNNAVVMGTLSATPEPSSALLLLLGLLAGVAALKSSRITGLI